MRDVEKTSVVWIAVDPYRVYGYPDPPREPSPAPPGPQAGFIFNLMNFQLRINQIMSLRAPGWNHIKFDQFSIKNQSNNEL
jgi:hypothetical protein